MNNCAESLKTFTVTELTEKDDVSLSSGMWFLKPYGASHPSQGSANLITTTVIRVWTHGILFYETNLFNQDKMNLGTKKKIAS